MTNILSVRLFVKNGRVFVRGSGFCGRLGRSSVSEFTEISGLKNKIISASAGWNYSLFMTSEGKVLVCGNNDSEELLTTEPGSSISTPVETTIRGDSSFCFAGCSISFVFVGTEPPANTPNRRINEKVTNEASLKVGDTTRDEFLRQQKEIAALKIENSELKEEIGRLLDLVSSNLSIKSERN